MLWTARYVAGIDPHRITDRIVFNPNYGGRSVGVVGACAVPIRTGKKGIKPDTRERIKQSVEREGFRNPIIVYRTKDGWFLSFGGGRLEAAKALDIPIPAIVVDYRGYLDTCPEVTEHNWREYFTDAPEYFEFTDVGISTHYNLESGREGAADEAGLAWASEEDMLAILKESPWLTRT